MNPQDDQRRTTEPSADRIDELVVAAISRTVGPFDFESWKRDHDEEIRQFQARTAAAKAQTAQRSPTGGRIMRILTNKRAIAAAVLLAIAGGAWFLGGDAGVAYALDQTVAANRQVRFLHLITLDPDDTDPDTWENRQEMWLELDEQGQPLRLRIEEGLGDAFRVLVLEGNTLRFWRPATGEWHTQHLYNVGQEIQRAIGLIDPRAAAEALDRLVAAGQVHLDVAEAEHGQLQLTVTSHAEAAQQLPPGWHADRTYVILVDPSTRLFTRMDSYAVKGGQRVLQMRYEYPDYDRPADPDLFVLAPPPDAAATDLTTGIGLSQGELTDAQAAADVVRRYILARVAQDYESAARLYNGKTADELRAWDEDTLKIRVLRLVEIGEPFAWAPLGPRGYRVPFTFEIETADGQRELIGPPSEHPEISGPREHLTAFVRPVAGQPDRWIITGGI